jgi:DNA polymerase-3 subunit alpha
MATSEQLKHTKLTEEDKYLLFLADEGIRRRYVNNSPEQMAVVMERGRYELSVIINKGFTAYFLILADLVRYCHRNDIAIGVGRGSAGGSMIAYCLGITEIDPIRYNLIFDRFLNMERFEYPDIDTDVDGTKRQQVIQYLADTYNTSHVAQIITFGTMSVKTLIQDVGRVLHLPREAVEKLKSLVPPVEKVTLMDCLDSDEFVEELKYWSNQDARLLPCLTQLEGLHRQTSIHAGGVIIATKPIMDLAPVYRPIGAKYEHERAVVQYEMTEAEEIGLLKMDILGLRTVTLVDRAEHNVRQWEDPDFNLRSMGVGDPRPYQLIAKGDTDGVFQLEGTGITRFAQEFQAQSFEELVALISLFRPGTLDSGTAAAYIRRKKGQEPVTYPHPDLEPVLKDTYGIIVYQEQVMQVAGVMAGYTMGRADGLRKAIGKKNKEKIESELAAFHDAAIARGYEEGKVQEIMDLMATFGRYGFNKSHAVAYAYLCYWTALLKAEHMVSFYAAELNTVIDDKLNYALQMAKAHHLRFLPPVINSSGSGFTIGRDQQGYNIQFGLSNVRGVGAQMVQRLISTREAVGPYHTFYEFLHNNTSLPVNAKEALIKSGAFDELGERQNLLFDLINANKFAKTGKYGKYLELRARARIAAPPAYSPLELGELEHDTLGYYLTADPLDAMVQIGRWFGGVPIGADLNEMIGATVTLVGSVVNFHPHRTKKGDPMGFLQFSDGVEQYSATCFPRLYAVNKGIKAGMLVQVVAQVDKYKGKPSLTAQSIQVVDLDRLTTPVTLICPAGNPMAYPLMKQWIGAHQGTDCNLQVVWYDSRGYRFRFACPPISTNYSDLHQLNMIGVGIHLG